MADEVKKILSLDAIPLLKQDFLKELAEERKIISEEYKKEIEDKAEELWNNFGRASDEDKQAILEQLTELGQKDETLAEGVESLRSAIQALNNKVNGLDQPESVLSDNDVKKIITASLIQKTFWTNDSINSPTVAGNEIVGLIGTFGKIKTENLEGTLIEGKTVQSIPDSEGNIAWQINNTGSGWLANKNITWDKEGNFNAKITGTFDGGTSGSVANGALTWEEDGVHIHENLIFDEDKGISWETLSGIPDIATKEYVDQSSGMTEEQFRTEIGNNWIKTADVTCQNLKVTKVDTAPTESGDKVTILGNTIQVLNDNDQPGLSISNNNINFKYSPESLKATASFETDPSGTEGWISIQKIYINGSGEILIGNGGETGPICEIGALNNTSMLSIACAVRLVSGTQISTSDYSITTANTSSRPYIAIYKYNDNTTDWDYAGKISCTSWDKVTMINGQPTTGTSYMYRFISSDYYFKLDRGIYALGLVLPDQSIKFENANYVNKPVQVRVDFNVYNIQRNLSSFVDIGKNGIVINSEKGNIYMDNSNIVMSMGTSESMYGIKITPNGMYFCNGDSSWTAWNPSNN